MSVKLKQVLVAAAIFCSGCLQPAKIAADQFCTIIDDQKGELIKTYDYLSLNYTLKTEEGDLLFSTGKFDQRPQLLFAAHPRFNSDLNTALTRLSEGDSAVVRVNLDSMVNKLHYPRPKTKGRYLIYNIRVNKVISRGKQSDSELAAAIQALTDQQVSLAQAAEPQKNQTIYRSKTFNHSNASIRADDGFAYSPFACANRKKLSCELSDRLIR